VNAKTRLIYKYHNRRLYDTAARRYTTLGHIRQLVLDGEDFVVRDKQTQGDITFVTLLNVLAQAHGSRTEPPLDREFLLNAIRAYGSSSASAKVAGHDDPTAAEIQYAARPYTGG